MGKMKQIILLFGFPAIISFNASAKTIKIEFLSGNPQRSETLKAIPEIPEMPPLTETRLFALMPREMPPLRLIINQEQSVTERPENYRSKIISGQNKSRAPLNARQFRERREWIRGTKRSY
jgi:hypothetical protein